MLFSSQSRSELEVSPVIMTSDALAEALNVMPKKSLSLDLMRL